MAAADALASLVLDRFVSASSAGDAHASLESILEALQNNNKLSSSSDNDETTTKATKLPPASIWNDDEILGALRHVLHTGQHKQGDMQVPVDEGASLVCKIYMEMLQQDSKCPLLDRDESLLECLIDVICNSNNSQGNNASNSDDGDNDDNDGVSMYTRVLALQLLTLLCTKRPSKAKDQLLHAPNGLHRLGDLLHINQEEILRNEALLMAQVIAEWPSCAQVWMFSEVPDQVMLMVFDEGGLTKGNLLVQDCLDLLFRLWKHNPNGLAEMGLSPIITNNLPRLLDLRQGTEFLNPPAKALPVSKSDDDLDDILNSASGNNKSDNDKPEEVLVPKLTASEEKVIEKTLDLLALLLESDSLKQSVWKRQIGLCNLLWELALVTPPSMPFVCAVPSPQLQQKALETTSLYFNDPALMERIFGLDRLLFLVCTGGLGATLEEKMGISQAALHVIRKTLGAKTANQMLMHTLAPPMTMDDDDDDGQGEPQLPPPTEVHRLLNTVAENLAPPPSVDPERRQVLLAGSLGGLSIFLSDQTSREVMLRITTTRTRSGEPVTNEEGDNDDDENDPTITRTSLIESILHAIGKLEEEQKPENAFLSMTLLRFLCHWSVETPSVVQTILSSNQSGVVISALLGIKTKINSHKKGVGVLGKLLLGLAMEFMGDDEGACGGWTRASIMELIAKKSGGVSKFTSTLEQFKSIKDFGDTMPWSVCELEYKEWARWFSKCVLLVRKRVVQELTGNGEGDEEGEDEDGPEMEGGAQGATTGSSTRSLQKVVYQQSQEIDELQETLRKANSKLESQQKELSTYKRRVESAPSQLDTMLNEYATKVSELESKVSSLEEESRVQQNTHDVEVESRDGQIRTLQTDLEKSKVQEIESRNETETLREEIGSLSQAYTSLEQQYRDEQLRQGREGGMTQSNTTSGSSHLQPANLELEEHPQHQPSNAGVGSTEDSTLRADNERLRNDAQAAEQWMTMAVEKMQTFAQQNAALQRELSQLSQNQSQGMNEQQLELQAQYQGLIDERQTLLQQQNQLQVGLSTVTQEKQNLQQAYSEIEDLLANLREELDSTRSSFEENRLQSAAERSEMESQLGAMARDLENAGIEITRLQDELSRQDHQHIESEHPAQSIAQSTSEREVAIASQSKEVNCLASIVEQQSADVASERQLHVTEIEALKASVGLMQQDLDMTHSELENIRRHEQEEIYKRESRIRELEDRIDRASGGHGGSLVEELKTKEVEIAELEAANESAQEWMQKAVAQFAMLNEQNASVGSENSTLIAQIRDLKAGAAQSVSAIARANVLEQESSLQTGRLGEAQASLAACEAELVQVRQELSARDEASDGATTEVQLLREEAETLQAKIQEQLSVGEVLRARLGSEEESKAGLVEELNVLKTRLESENRSIDDAESDRPGKAATTLSASLVEKEAICEELRKEVDVLKADIEQLNVEIESLRSSEVSSDETHQVSELSTELQAAQKENSGLVLSQERDKNSIEKLRDEISALRKLKDESAPTPQSAVTSVQDFFSAGSEAAVSNGGTAPVQQPAAASNAHDFLTARPATTTNNGVSSTAQDFFGGSATSGVENAQDFFSAGDLTTVLRDNPPQGQNQHEEVTATDLVDGAQRVEWLKAQLEESREGLESVRGKLANEGLDQGRIIELETTVSALQKELGERVQEIDNKTESHSSLEARNAELIRSLELANVNAEQAVPENTTAEGSENGLNHELLETKASLARALAKLEDDDQVVAKWEERVVELEIAVKDLEEQLAEQDEAADGVIEQWQESYTALQSKNSELALSQVSSAMIAREGEVGDRPGNNQEQVAELETIVKDLRVQLSEQEEGAETVINKWQESCNSLEEKNSELLHALESAGGKGGISSESFQALKSQLAETEKALADARETLGGDDDAVLRWQERVADLESALKDSEVQEEEMQSLISKWQETCSELEKEKKDSQLSLSLEKSAAVSELQEKLVVAEKDLSTAKDMLNTDDNVNTLWQERIGELEITIKGLESQLQQEDKQASDVISKWEESYKQLEQTQAESMAELMTALESKESVSNDFASLQLQLNETQTALDEAMAKINKESREQVEVQERVAELETAITDLEQQRNDQENQASVVVAQCQETATALGVANEVLSDQLQQTNGQLESTQDEKLALQLKLAEAHAALAEFEEKLAHSEARVVELVTANATAQESLETELQVLRDSTAWLQTQLQDREFAITEATEQAAGAEGTIQEWEKHAADLEAKVADLEEQLREEEQAAIDAISLWETKFMELQASNTELTQSLEASFNRSKILTEENDSLASSQAQLTETEVALSGETKKALDWKEQVAHAEAMVKSLQQQLLDNENEANATQERLQQSIAAYESSSNELSAQLQDANAQILAAHESKEEDSPEKLEALQASLDDARDLLRAERENQSATEASLQESQGKVAELETKLQVIAEEIDTKHEETAVVSAQWQNHSSALEKEKTDLLRKLDEAKGDRSATMFDASLDVSEKDKHAELETKIETLQQESKEMANTVAEWQAHSVLLGDQNTELLGKLEEAQDSLKETEASLEEAHDSLKETETSLEEAQASSMGTPYGAGREEGRYLELEATIKLLEQGLDESENNAADAVAAWQEGYEKLQATKDALAADLESLREIGGITVPSSEDGNNVRLTPTKSSLEESIQALEAELRATPDAAIVAELKLRCVAKDKALSMVSAQLESTIKERDQANTIVQSKEQEDNNEIKVAELHTNLQRLKDEHGEVMKAKASLKSQVQDLETERSESEEAIKQWTEQTKQLEEAVCDMEKQLEQQSAQGDEAISVWESRCSDLQASFAESQSGLEASRAYLFESQSGLEACRVELRGLLRSELEIHDRLLASYDHDFKADTIMSETDAALKSKLTERNVQLGSLMAKQDSDINALFVEIESLRSSEVSQGDAVENDDTDALVDDDLLKSQMVDLQMTISDNLSTISQLKQSLVAKDKIIRSIEVKLKEEDEAKIELQSEIKTLKEKLNLAFLAEEEAQLHAGEEEDTDKTKLQDSLVADRAKLMKLNERLSEMLTSAQEGKSQLEKATTESNNLQESLNAEKDARQKERDGLEKESAGFKTEKDDLQAEVECLTSILSVLEEKLQDASAFKVTESLDHTVVQDLEKEKDELEAEVARLTTLTSELDGDLQEANNVVQIYIAKEVSDNATEMATHALRQQLGEIRRQSDSDHTAYLTEKEARVAAESEVERLRADLFALVDVSEQEMEIYGADALTIKAADKIHKKERSEIAELKETLSRAFSDLQTSRAGERDAEERAARAAHHVVVCEQELAAVKSELTFCLQTMDETRQDEESKRASLENRIQSLENDSDVTRRFVASETDSLRNELTQVMMEKDRTLQLLKDSEKNKAAMVFAASQNFSASSKDSPEIELAKLRVEKAQLLVAAADEGARTERRLREVIAADLSSTEADVLVANERRLAAETACDNMKLLVTELQNEVQSYREDSRVAKSPSNMRTEQENVRVKADIERIMEENLSLQTKLDAAKKAHENANYRIEKLMANCRTAQAASNRLDREMKFQSEMRAEINRMQPPPPKAHDAGDPAKPCTGDMLPEIVDQIEHQKEAIEKEREMYRSLHSEHEELLEVLGYLAAVPSLADAMTEYNNAKHGGQEEGQH